MGVAGTLVMQDLFVIDMGDDPEECPLQVTLGRSFMATTRAIQKIHSGYKTTELNNQLLTFNQMGVLIRSQEIRNLETIMEAIARIKRDDAIRKQNANAQI